MMFEPGIITVVVVVLLFPFALVVATLMDISAVLNCFRRFLLRQSPREQELTKASWGAALLVIGAGVLWVAGSAHIQKCIDALGAWPNDPLHWAPALVFLLVISWGVLWFLTGTRRALAFGQERDARLIIRALYKIAFGLVIAILLSSYGGPPRYWPRVIPITVVTWPVLALVAWLTVTGATKFLLVARGRRQQRPAPVPPPKPPARDATPDEAYEDMRGHGGRKTSLDDRSF
jgi:hypothetical protein